MVSVITDRISGGVAAGAQVNPGRIYQASNVTGINDIECDTFPSLDQYFPNMLLLIRPDAANTGPTTIDAGPGILPWRTPSGAEHTNGALSTNIEYLVKLSADMTEFRTISPF